MINKFWFLNKRWLVMLLVHFGALIGIEFLGIYKSSKLSIWLAIIYLSLIILCSGMTVLWPWVWGRKFWVWALVRRRDLGILSGFLTIWHGLLTWQQLANWKWSFLILPAVLPGVIALGIMSLLLLTSSQLAVKSLGQYWKILHRTVYLALPLILMHIIFAGRFFANELPLQAFLILALIAWSLLVDLFFFWKGKKITIFWHLISTLLGFALCSLLYFTLKY